MKATVIDQDFAVASQVMPALSDAGLGHVRMLLQVHDELVFEVPVKETNQVATLVKEVMEDAVGPSHTLSVPLVVETGSAQNWEEAH